MQISKKKIQQQQLILIIILKKISQITQMKMKKRNYLIQINLPKKIIKMKIL